jgi:hypothetical protein
MYIENNKEISFPLFKILLNFCLDPNPTIKSKVYSFLHQFYREEVREFYDLFQQFV